jgi:hypothetical protein
VPATGRTLTIRNIPKSCRNWTRERRHTLAQLEGGAADVFGAGGGNGAAPAAVDVKSLHAKIGELTLENDF